MSLNWVYLSSEMPTTDLLAIIAMGTAVVVFLIYFLFFVNGKNDKK